MSWPRGRPRPKKVGSESTIESAEVEQADAPRDPNQLPDGWRKGALLNVRTHHHHAPYVITLWPEEYDAEKPERSISFTNGGECQDFVSRWYAAENHDPRAR